MRPLPFVHDGDDQHVITAKLIDDAKGETSKGPLAQIVDKDRPALWSVGDLCERSLKRDLEALGDLGSILFEPIPAPCSLGLSCCTGMPAKLNHPPR